MGPKKCSKGHLRMLEALEGWGISTHELAELFEALDPAEELEEFVEAFE